MRAIIFIYKKNIWLTFIMLLLTINLLKAQYPNSFYFTYDKISNEYISSGHYPDCNDPTKFVKLAFHFMQKDEVV